MAEIKPEYTEARVTQQAVVPPETHWNSQRPTLWFTGLGSGGSVRVEVTNDAKRPVKVTVTVELAEESA